MERAGETDRAVAMTGVVTAEEVIGIVTAEEVSGDVKIEEEVIGDVKTDENEITKEKMTDEIVIEDTEIEIEDTEIEIGDTKNPEGTRVEDIEKNGFEKKTFLCLLIRICAS